MIDIQKFFLALTPAEVFKLTNTTNLIDAEIVVTKAYEQSSSSTKAILVRILFGCIGATCIFFTSVLLPAFLFGLFFLYMAFFGRISGRRQIRKKCIELQKLIQSLEGYPELLIENSVAQFIPQSALGSRAATINDIGNLYMNTDSTKHLWGHAGFCSVDTGRRTNDFTAHQQYYVFSYSFNGKVPQILLLHKKDPFLTLTSPNNRVLQSPLLSWQCIVPMEYEIEALTILTPDLIFNLEELAKQEPACTLELCDSTLLCFIPVDKPDTSGLFMYEKNADNFARILIPKLSGSNVSKIGNIPLALSVDDGHNENEDIEFTENEKKRNRWLIILPLIFIVLFIGSLVSGIFQPKYLLLMTSIFVILTVTVMSKRVRKQWLSGSGLRINGRGIRVQEEKD